MEISKNKVDLDGTLEFYPGITSTGKPNKQMKKSEYNNITFETKSNENSFFGASNSSNESNKYFDNLSAMNFDKTGLEQTLNPSVYNEFSAAGTSDLHHFAEYHKNIVKFNSNGPPRILLNETSVETDSNEKSDETLGYLDNNDHDIEILDSVIQKNPSDINATIVQKKFIENKKKRYLLDKLNIQPAVELIDAYRSNVEKSKPETKATTNPDIKLKANKIDLAWVGVSIRGDVPTNINSSKIPEWLNKNAMIKKVLLTYEAHKSVEIRVSIKQNDALFFITDSNGSINLTKSSLLNKPRTNIPLYLKFYPKHTGYCTAIVIIQMQDKSYQLNLFGYASSGYISFDKPLSLQVSNSSKSYSNSSPTVHCELQIENLNNIPVRVRNVGSRDIYVVCISPDVNIHSIRPVYMSALKDGEDCVKTITLSLKNYVPSVTVDIMYADVDLIKTAHYINNQWKMKDLEFDEYFNKIMELGFRKCASDDQVQFENFSKHNKFDFRKSLMEQISKNLTQVKFIMSSGRTVDSVRFSGQSPSVVGYDHNSCSNVGGGRRNFSELQYINEDGISSVSTVCRDEINKLCKHLDKRCSLIDQVSNKSSDSEIDSKENLYSGIGKNESLERICMPISKVTIEKVACGKSSFGCFIIANKTRNSVKFHVYGLESTSTLDMNPDFNLLSIGCDPSNHKRPKQSTDDSNDEDDESIFSLGNVPSLSGNHVKYAVIMPTTTTSSDHKSDLLVAPDNDSSKPVMSGSIKPRGQVCVVIKFSPYHAGTFYYTCRILIEGKNGGPIYNSSARIQELVKFVDVTCSSRDPKASYTHSSKMIPVSTTYSNMYGLEVKANYNSNQLLWTIELKNKLSSKQVVYVRMILVYQNVGHTPNFRLHNTVESSTLQPGSTVAIQMYDSGKLPTESIMTLKGALVYNSKAQYVYLSHEYLKN